MRHSLSYLLTGSFLFMSWLPHAVQCQGIQRNTLERRYAYDHQGIVRGDKRHRTMAWVFTGDEYFEGMSRIADILSDKGVKGSFFLTGRLYRNPGARSGILRLKGEGHYLGPHSDQHLLYNDWTRRDSLLVSRDSMQQDLLANYAAMDALGIRLQRRRYFIPPYEWWNEDVSGWCREMGVQVINFTPGTGTNADYTYPQMGASYRISDTLAQRLLRFEAYNGLSGAIVLVHIGTDPRRTDKFFERLPWLIDRLRDRGYRFVRIDRLLRKSAF